MSHNPYEVLRDDDENSGNSEHGEHGEHGEPYVYNSTVDSLSKLGYSAEELSRTSNELKYAVNAFSSRYNANLRMAEYRLRVALFVSFVVVIAAAAVLTALYAPQHMPNAIANIVNNLSKVAHDAILGTAYGVGGVALLSMFYMSKNSCVGRRDQVIAIDNKGQVTTVDYDETQIHSNANYSDELAFKSLDPGSIRLDS